MRQTTVLLYALVALFALTAAACSKARTPPKTASAPPHAASATEAKPTPMPPQTEPTVGNVTSTPSEHIATGRPQKAKYVGSPDAVVAVYHGNPQMKLDSKTLADVRATIDQTCQLLEEGVDLLEKYAKKPEKAAKAIRNYRKKHAARVQRVFKAAADVRARLRSVGYDQDIPEEVRPDFERRMGAIQARLEKMRTTYRKHRDVLEAFGALFPRAP